MESIRKTKNNALALHFQSALQIPTNESQQPPLQCKNVLLAKFFTKVENETERRNPNFSISAYLQSSGLKQKSF